MCEHLQFKITAVSTDYLSPRILYTWKKKKFETFCISKIVICLGKFQVQYKELFYLILKVLYAVSFFNCFSLKGQSSENSVFWHIWIGLGLSKNRFWLNNFSEAPTILDLRNSSSRGEEESLLENFYKYQKFISEYFSYTIDLFRKPIS